MSFKNKSDDIAVSRCKIKPGFTLNHSGRLQFFQTKARFSLNHRGRLQFFQTNTLFLNKQKFVTTLILRY